MNSYKIEGGRPIYGEIKCLGAKNFATKAMIASILSSSPSTLTNVPPIGDVSITKDMLQDVGVEITENGTTMELNPKNLIPDIIKPHSGSNRMPILILGALLHKFDTVYVPVLGGCKIGSRSVNYHLDAIIKFGGTVKEHDSGFVAKKESRLLGAKIELPYPSVGATETCLYLSVLASGTSIIKNAALEPEIFELITMLRSMGAIIYTTSGREFRIEGVEKLHGTKMDILGDRIEAASWASLAAASDGEITVNGIRPEILGNFLSSFREAGGGFELVGEKSIRFFRATSPISVIIETDVYPGFSTDWQQPFSVLLTQAKGISIIHETVYENRFGYLSALKRLGANIQTTSHALGNLPNRFLNSGKEISAIISGPTPLKATNDKIEIPDLRAGLAYVIAAAVAKGTTILEGVARVERGYGDIVPRLKNIGLKIEKV